MSPWRIAPALFLVVGGLVAVRLGNVVEHEAAPFLVEEDASFAAHAFGDEDPLHAGRPDHAGGMELDELHVHQLGAGAVGERVAVASAFPAVAGDLVGAPRTAGREDDRRGVEHLEAAPLAFVADDAVHPAVAAQQADDGELHVHVEAAVDSLVLQRANQLEAGAIPDVRQPRVAVAAEVALQDAAVLRAIEHRAPRLELADAIGRFLRVQFGHPPVVDVLAAAHGVGEVHPPAVAIVHVGQRRGDAAFRHDRVRLAEQRLADQADLHAGRRRFDRRAETGAAGANDEDVVFERFEIDHSRR